MLPVNIPQFFQEYSNLKFHHIIFPLFLLLIPVPFPVTTPQVSFFIMIHVYYPALHHQKLLLIQFMFHTLHTQGCHHWQPEVIHMKIPVLVFLKNQVFFYLHIQLHIFRGLHHIHPCSTIPLYSCHQIILLELPLVICYFTSKLIVPLIPHPSLLLLVHPYYCLQILCLLQLFLQTSIKLKIQVITHAVS